MDFGIGNRLAVVAVAIPALAGLLTQPSQLDQRVGHQGLPRSGFLELMQLLTNAPGDVQAAHVIDGKNPHGHAPVGQDAIDLFGCGAFFH